MLNYMSSKDPPPYNVIRADTRGKILLAAANNVSGYNIVDVYGIVTGTAVRERGIGIYKPKQHCFEGAEYKKDTACTNEVREQVI